MKQTHLDGRAVLSAFLLAALGLALVFLDDGNTCELVGHFPPGLCVGALLLGRRGEATRLRLCLGTSKRKREKNKRKNFFLSAIKEKQTTEKQSKRRVQSLLEIKGKQRGSQMRQDDQESGGKGLWVLVFIYNDQRETSNRERKEDEGLV